MVDWLLFRVGHLLRRVCRVFKQRKIKHKNDYEPSWQIVEILTNQIRSVEWFSIQLIMQCIVLVLLKKYVEQRMTARTT